MTCVLVTGATGTFGSAVAEALEALEADIRLLVRDPSGLSSSAHPVFVGDLSDRRVLEASLTDVDAMFLASFDRPEMLEAHRTAIEVAAGRGVERIARISSMGVDDPAFQSVMSGHVAGEKILEDSGVPFVHLRPSWVLQNFLPTSAATPVVDGEISLPAGSGRVGFVDARDVGLVAAIALTEDGFDNTIIEMTGPTAVTHGELADALSGEIGNAIRYRDMSPEEYRQRLLRNGWTETSAANMDVLFASVRSGVWARLTPDVERVTGQAPRSVTQFARDYAGNFT